MTYSPDAHGGLDLPASEIGMVVLVIVGLFLLLSWIAVFLSVLRIDKALKQLVALLNERLPSGSAESSLRSNASGTPDGTERQI